MNIMVNGAPTEVPESTTVADVLETVGHHGAAFGIAVALNGEVVVRDGWTGTQLSEGDLVEVLVAAQGG